MKNKNIRSYGLIIKENKLLVCNEVINNFSATKFPGGGVEKNETPEKALIREIYEELSLTTHKTILIHSPGTLLSPWNNKLYTPLYFYIKTSGLPIVPSSENLSIDYLSPEEIFKKKNIANPEKIATEKLLKLKLVK